MKRCAAALLISTLSACAFNGDPASDLAYLTGPAVMRYVQADLAKSEGMSPESITAEENRLFQKAEPDCIPIYDKALLAIIYDAGEQVKARNPNASTYAVNNSEHLESELSKCLGKYGLTGYAGVELPGGEQLTVPNYLLLLVDKGRAVVSAQYSGYSP